MVVLLVVGYGFSYKNDRQVFLQYMNSLIVLYLLLLHAIHFDHSVLVAFLHCHQQIVSSDHDFSHFQMHSLWHHSYNHLHHIELSGFLLKVGTRVFVLRPRNI